MRDVLFLELPAHVRLLLRDSCLAEGDIRLLQEDNESIYYSIKSNYFKYLVHDDPRHGS
jgi:hypothetical protein